MLKKILPYTAICVALLWSEANAFNCHFKVEDLRPWEGEVNLLFINPDDTRRTRVVNSGESFDYDCSQPFKKIAVLYRGNETTNEDSCDVRGLWGADGKPAAGEPHYTIFDRAPQKPRSRISCSKP